MLEISHIITAVIATIIATIFLGIVNWLIQKYKSKKFPVCGEYITYFDEIKQGQLVTTTSISKLKQKGMRVFGKTTQADRKSWNLEGNIVGSGHITGVYSANEKYDEGVGSFYLKIIDDNLEGFWSGYDNKNKFPASGKYIFRKKAYINILTARNEDITKILDFSSPLFGEGYVDDVRDLINNKNSVALVAVENGDIVGFILGKLCVPDEAKTLINSSEKLPADLENSDKEGALGIIKTLGVASSRQGHGIGGSLFSNAESRLKKLGAKTIIIPAWKSGNIVNIGGLLNQFSYNHFLSDLDYWKSDCEEGKFRCPSKSGEKCVCSVEIYKKSL